MTVTFVILLAAPLAAALACLWSPVRICQAVTIATGVASFAAVCVLVPTAAHAVSGGLVSPSYATLGGIGEVVPVDVWAPGAPPSPFQLLHALLLGLGRLRGDAGVPGVTS